MEWKQLKLFLFPWKIIIIYNKKETMIYLENNNGTQQIFIPKNLNISINKTYDEGFQDGINYQKDKLEVLNVTENGVYKSDNGYKQVNVEVANEDVCKLEELNITIVNDIEEYTATDTNLDGFSKVNVDATEFGESRYNLGYERGYEQGKSDIGCNVGFKYHIVKDEHETINSPEFGYDGFNEVEIDASEFGRQKYEEGYNQGKSECGEGGSCNLDDLNVEWQPNWNSNVWYAENYGFDGYRAVSINAEKALQEKYNEGYEQGKSEGGSCNIQNGSFEFEDISNGIFSQYAQDHGVDGWNYIEVDASNYGNQKYDEGYEQGKNETVQNLKPIKITSNGTYNPEKSYYLTMDSDDCFPLGTFGNRIAFEIKIDITEKSDERKYILGNWVNDTFQGIWCDNNIGFDWGKYYGAYVGIPNGIFIIKWWSDDDGNYSFSINDEGYSMPTDGVDFTSIDLLLGALNNTCTNFNFYDLKIWNDSSSYLNGNEPDYVYSVGEAENAIYKNSEVVENIGDGAYAFKVEYQGSFGYSEVVVELFEPEYASKAMTFEVIGITSPKVYKKIAYKTINWETTDKFILLFEGNKGELWTYNGIDGVALIAQNAFKEYNQFKSINFRRINIIGSQAFQDSVNLESIELFGVGRIGENTFKNCTSLNKITFVNDTKPIIGTDAFTNIAENGTLYVPNDNEYWMNFKNNYLPNGWTTEIISE